jgi:tRNA threonylcarbamoyladenosine biosynthesis protein TsaB
VTCIILAIETSANVGAVCVSRNGEVTREIVRDHAKLSSWIIPAIDRVMSRGALSVQEIDAIAFGRGPGAFTGVRTACTTAQALAYAWAKPLFSVSSAEALAVSAIDTFAPTNRPFNSINVILDARMNQAFYAEYSGHAYNELILHSEISLRPMSSLALNDVDARYVGSGALAIAKRDQLGDETVNRIRSLTDFAETNWADAVAAIARHQISKGVAPLDPRHAAPEYIRNNVALTERERRALRSNEALTA